MGWLRRVIPTFDLEAKGNADATAKQQLMKESLNAVWNLGIIEVAYYILLHFFLQF